MTSTHFDDKSALSEGGHAPARRFAKTNIPSFEGLRALAALGVLLSHAAPVGMIEMPADFEILKSFSYGVQVFFVLSCASLLLNNDFESMSDLRAYYIKRFFRIFPLYYFFIMLYVYYFYSPSILQYIILFTMTFEVVDPSANIVWAGWTLGIEVIFYVLLPLVMIVFRTDSTRNLAYVIVIAGSFLGHYALYYSNPQSTYFQSSFIANMGCFAVGALVFEHREFLKRHAKWKPVLWLCGSVLWVAAHYRFYDTLPFLFSNARMWFGFAAGLMIAAELSRPTLALGGRSWVWLSSLSYGIYLWHPFVLYKLRSIFAQIYAAIGNIYVSYVACVVVAGFVTVVLSVITFQVIEKWFIRLGKHVADVRRPHATG
jgi:peptidoglycan/LPS O-acetylase OafA/YrhL